MKKIYSISLILISILLFSACQDSLLNTSPYGSISSNNMWKTEALADKGVLGIYNALRYDYIGLYPYKYEALSVAADVNGPETDQNVLFGKAATGNGLFSSYWKQHFEGVHRANDAIDHLPQVPMDPAKRERLIAESKFLRAFFYYRMNQVFKGVPLYLHPIELKDCTKGKTPEKEIWNQILADLTDCIQENNPNPPLPPIYKSGDPNYGRITRGAAYALRGKTYLWMVQADPTNKNTYYQKAIHDFLKVKECGYELFKLPSQDHPGDSYKQLFKEKNEQSPEMIFSLQCIGISGLGNDLSKRYGNRSSFGSSWDSYFVNTDFVNSYQNKDGSPFKWDDVIPGFDEKTPRARSVYFFRDSLSQEELGKLKENYGADITLYQKYTNEARIKQAYANRDPRLQASVITPYSTFLGASSMTDHTYTYRFPYIGYSSDYPFDLQTNAETDFCYLFRKFVAEGANEIPNREYSPIDIPLIRYADILLNLAEAYNETGKSTEAIACVNEVRSRAGVAPLNSNVATQVAGQDDLRERIRNERRWELAGEGIDFFDELRWHTWQQSKFMPKYNGQPIIGGQKRAWGDPIEEYSWDGDYLYNWPVPQKEVEMNPNLKQVAGWRS